MCYCCLVLYWGLNQSRAELHSLSPCFLQSWGLNLGHSTTELQPLFPSPPTSVLFFSDLFVCFCFLTGDQTHGLSLARQLVLLTSIPSPFPAFFFFWKGVMLSCSVYLQNCDIPTSVSRGTRVIELHHHCRLCSCFVI